ncbi:hypothetical protein SE17_02525 [Kouleothrix aurantiaca]|uniref:DNA primase/polymerase bifunctional N-terminal domain-containing protein n=1 Tax=Kouleothrix aurantiaca TaxID=186479 RepID=A0A0P9HIH8_9CHLR|nr:hypothetical protein SE17_02525 [Kouleothrix aurantiaca]
MDLREQKQELRRIGCALLPNGYSIIPIGSDKRPFARLLPLLWNEDGSPVMGRSVNEKTGEVYEYQRHGWNEFQTRRATLDELYRWLKAGAQLALVCGEISGGLLVIDFDRFNNGSEDLFEQWADACEARGFPVRSLPRQQTGSGGWQVAVRCDQPGENTKLAWVLDTNETLGRKIAIETRGAGGYAVIAPSRHPNGNFYRMDNGEFYETPRWPQVDVNAILNIARSMSQVEDKPVIQHATRSVWSGCANQDSVIDRYNAQTDVREVLRRFGYADAFSNRMHRPGRGTHSVPSVHIGDDNRSFHHSNNDELRDGFWHTPFSVRCKFEFGDDARAAVRAIAAELGMVVQPEFRNDVAFCPYHPTHELQVSQKSGFYCPNRTNGEFCKFRWEGVGYEAPDRSVASRLPRRMAFSSRPVDKIVRSSAARSVDEIVRSAAARPFNEIVRAKSRAGV